MTIDTHLLDLSHCLSLTNKEDERICISHQKDFICHLYAKDWCC